MAAQLRKDLFESILKQDIQFFDKSKSGEVMSRLSSDVQEFKSSFKHVVSHGLRCLTQVNRVRASKLKKIMLTFFYRQ